MNPVKDAFTSCRHVLSDMLGMPQKVVKKKISMDDCIYGRSMRVYAGLTTVDKLLTEVMDPKKTPINELNSRLTDTENLISRLKELTSPDNIEKALPLFNVHHTDYLVKEGGEMKIRADTLKKKFDEDHADLVVDFILRMYKTSKIKADIGFINEKGATVISIKGREGVSPAAGHTEIKFLQGRQETRLLISGIGDEECRISHDLSSLLQKDTPVVYINADEENRNKIRDTPGTEFIHINDVIKKPDTLLDVFNSLNWLDTESLLIIHPLDEEPCFRVSSTLLRKLHKAGKKKETLLSTLSILSGKGGVEASYNTLFSLGSLINHADVTLIASKPRLTEISRQVVFTKGKTLDEKTHNLIVKSVSFLIPVLVNLFLESKTRDKPLNRFIIPGYYELPKDSFEKISGGALWENLKLWIKETADKYMFTQCGIRGMDPVVLVVSAPYTRKELTEEELKKIGESLGEEYGIKKVVINFIQGDEDFVKIGVLAVPKEIQPVIQELVAFNRIR